MSVVTFINGFEIGFVLGAVLEAGRAFIPHFQKILVTLTVVLTAVVLAFGNLGVETASHSWHLLGVFLGTVFGGEATEAAIEA